MSLISFFQSIHKANNIQPVIDYSNLVYNKTTAHLGQSAPQSTQDYITLYQIHSDIYRAINVKSTSIAQLPVDILKKSGDEFESIFESSDFDVLRQYNRYQTHYDFWEATIGYLEMTGEAFWLLDLGAGDKILEMVPLRPDLLTVHPHNELIISHYTFNRGGEQIRIPPENIFFIKYFNPADHLRGLSPIRAAQSEIVLDIQASTSVKRTLEKGARPSALLTPKEDEIEDTEYKKLIKHIRDEYQGVDNYGKILALNYGMDWQQLQYTNEELQLLDIRKGSSKAIQKVFGVPPIYFMDYSDASVLANADQQERQLWDTLNPILIKLNQIFTEFLLLRITNQPGLVFKFNTKDIKALQPDKEKQVKIFKEGIQNGAVKPQEMRTEVFGLEPSDNPALDEFYLPANLIPITGSEESAETENVQQEMVRAVNKLVEASSVTLNQEVQRAINGIEDNQYIKTVLSTFLRNYAAVNRIVQKHGTKFAKKLRSFFIRQKKEVLANINAAKMYKFDSSTDIMFDVKKWIKEFEAEGKVFIALALEESAKQLAKELGEVFTITDPAIGKWVNQTSHQYATIVNETTVKKIDSLVKVGLSSGASIAEVADSIKKYFDAQSVMRSTRISRTEMVRATNKGRLEMMKQSKKINFHMWLSQRDENVRDSHFEADGKVVKIGEPFPLGAGYGGDPTYPSDINERCITIPVKKKKDINFELIR